METKNRELQLEEVKGVSLWRDAWRRLLKNRMAVLGGLLYFFLFLWLFLPHLLRLIPMSILTLIIHR
ncbi:MAG: hypothetical protein ACK4TN_02945 [Brevinematales bacterium]